MPLTTAWDTAFETGDDGIDTQHRRMLSLCNRLAELCSADDALFDQTVADFKALTREHFVHEATLLAAQGEEAVEDHRFEREEFDHLADEVATPAFFSRLEIQRFVALWCIGHIQGSMALPRGAQPHA